MLRARGQWHVHAANHQNTSMPDKQVVGNRKKEKTLRACRKSSKTKRRTTIKFINYYATSRPHRIKNQQQVDKYRQIAKKMPKTQSTYVRGSLFGVLVINSSCNAENANSARGLLRKWHRSRGAKKVLFLIFSFLFLVLLIRIFVYFLCCLLSLLCVLLVVLSVVFLTFITYDFVEIYSHSYHVVIGCVTYVSCFYSCFLDGSLDYCFM